MIRSKLIALLCLTLFFTSCSWNSSPTPRMVSNIHFLRKNRQVEITIYGDKNTTHQMIYNKLFSWAELACTWYIVLSHEVLNQDKHHYKGQVLLI